MDTKFYRPRWLSAAGLVGWILLCFAAAWVGTSAAPGPWYASLRKPTWNPPNWIFGPVWSVLYTLMGISAWQVWRLRPSGPRRQALVLFLVQLALNAAWSPVFFGRQDLFSGLIVILLLLLAILGTCLQFFALNRPAGLLLLPYLGWVGFASLLNAVLWLLNRDR